MRKIFFILIAIPSFSFAEGPLFQHKDSAIQQEFENAYQDLRTKISTTTGITSLDATILTGLVPNASIDGSSITKQGNVFNGANQLLQADSSGLISNADIDSSSVTKQGNAFNGANQLLQADSSGLIPNANIDSSSVTKQGNTFNDPNKLIRADSSGYVPNANIDGSSVTKLGTGNIAFPGRTTNVNQPGFSAYNSATDVDVTGDGTSVTVDFDTEVYDMTSDFSADTFQAPVGGKYLFTAGVTHQAAGGYKCEIHLVTSNRTYALESHPSTGVSCFSFSILADMDVSDTAFVRLNCSNGVKAIDVYGTGATTQATGNPTYFTGVLIQ